MIDELSWLDSFVIDYAESRNAPPEKIQLFGRPLYLDVNR